MKITGVRTHRIRIPYDAGPALFRFGAGTQPSLETVLLEVSTDAGLTGWGDVFAYASAATAASAVAEMVAPQAVGQGVPEAAGIPAFMERLQRNLHIFGRYGITMFALSGLDIALWDLAAKAQGLPLYRLLGMQGMGGRKRARLPAYASLLKIGDPAKVATEAAGAAARGYPAVKLHETTVEAVFAARAALGERVPLMVDMNCPLDQEGATAFAHACREARPKWIEEPVWPPEDFGALAAVRMKGGVDIAAGENACTAYQFRQMMAAGAVSYVQPSVIKVGGITEFVKVTALADDRGIKVAPHSPYFGPGFLATLHLLSTRDDDSLAEVFYMRREACLWGRRIEPDGEGHIAVPEGPGLGYEPDREVMERYAVR